MPEADPPLAGLKVCPYAGFLRAKAPSATQRPVKEIIVLVQRSPFNTLRNSEGLRMSVGLTLEEENKVTVAFLGDGVYLLQDTKPELIGSGVIRKHLDALKLLGHKVVAEKESLEERGIRQPGLKAEVVSRAEVFELLSRADAVIPW